MYYSSKKMTFKTMQFDYSEINFKLMSTFLAHNAIKSSSSFLTFTNKAEIITSLEKAITRKRKSKEDIDTYTLGSENHVFCSFLYDSKEFRFKIISSAKSLMHGCTAESRPYQILIVEYEDIEALGKMLKEASDFYKKYVCNSEKKENQIRVCSNESSYFCNINILEKRNFDTIYLPEEKINSIRRDMNDFLSEETKKKYLRFSKPYRRGYMFYGPPGSGKTSFIHALASELDKDICSYSFDPEMNDISFNCLLTNIKEDSILVLEDMDCTFNVSNREDKRGVTIGGLLNALDGLKSKLEIVIITTNNRKIIDPALTRPGRVDMFLEFTFAVEEQVRKMYKSFIYEDYKKESEDEFMKEYKKLRIKISTALLQSFFFKYINNHPELLKNIDEIKQMKELSDPGDESRLYC